MPDQSPRARLVVMLSGGGRTALNLLDAIAAGTLRADMVGAIASRPCAGVDRLIARAVPVEILTGEIPAHMLGARLASLRADLVALCGYMRYINVPPGFEGRILNIHPALLPKHGGPGFYGSRVHEAVIRAGERRSGCTVHLVDAQYDHGPIVLQRACDIPPGETPQTLAARVFALECATYPEALQLVIDRLVSRSGAGATTPAT